MTRTTPPPRYDIAALFPELAPLAKQTVRLHPRPGPEPPANASKLGGHILWPADESWPVCTEPEEEPKDRNAPPHDHLYIPILQLRRDDFPEFPFPDGADLFQLLWCPNYHYWNIGPISKAYWRNEANITNPLERIPTPAHIEEDLRPRSCVLHTERITEYPIYSDLPNELAEQIRNWEEDQEEYDIYEVELSIAPGSKLGGYPRWIQSGYTPTCECGREMEHLLTIASDELGGGDWLPWCPIEDVEATGLSIAQLQDGHAWIDALMTDDRRTGISYGDVGSVYVFVCRHCPYWPIATAEEMH